MNHVDRVLAAWLGPPLLAVLTLIVLAATVYDRPWLVVLGMCAQWCYAVTLGLLIRSLLQAWLTRETTEPPS